MRSLGSPPSMLKDTRVVVRSSKNLHCSGPPTTWRVDLYSRNLSALPTTPFIWMTWANHNLIKIICLDHLLYTVPVAVWLSPAHSLYPEELFPSGPSVSYLQNVQSGCKTYKLCLFQWPFSISAFPFSQPMLCSWNAGMWQKEKLTGYQRCPGLM